MKSSNADRNMKYLQVLASESRKAVAFGRALICVMGVVGLFIAIAALLGWVTIFIELVAAVVMMITLVPITRFIQKSEIESELYTIDIMLMAARARAEKEQQYFNEPEQPDDEV